jgi:ESX-1 secreted protein B PE domain
MTQTLDVEYQELMARADEIEAPLPSLPIGNPQAPCSLSFVRDAAVQIAINADTLRLYIRACEREWKALAKSLRNAAKAYEEVDEGAADDINATNMDGSTSGSGAKTSAAEDEQMSLLCDPDYIPPPPPPPPPFQYPYYEVRQAAKDIESPDQGTAFRAFASEWDRYQRTFQQLSYRFRPFLSWEGEARAAVEQNFDSQRTWISKMVANCSTLRKQAQAVADAHKKVRPSGTNGAEYYGLEGEHPASYEVSQCDYWYKYYVQTKSPYLYMALDWYKKLQTRSETAISNYIQSAGIPLDMLQPESPSRAYIINPPVPDDGGDDPNPNPNPDPVVPETPSDPSANMPTTPTLPTMPSTGMGGTPATPATPDTQKMIDDAMKKGGPPKGGAGGVKPASVGGGVGGAGVPKMPLQGAGDGEAGSRPAAAGPGAGTAGLGKGLPGAGGAGGGMGGGMPMGAGAGKDGQGKGKRLQSEDDALYTEERAWTEGVIGNRPRKGPSEK